MLKSSKYWKKGKSDILQYISFIDWIWIGSYELYGIHKLSYNSHVSMDLTVCRNICVKKYIDSHHEINCFRHNIYQLGYSQESMAFVLS